MNHQELLDTALDAAGYFVKSSTVSQSYQSLTGYTIEDIAMDAVERILLSQVPLESLSKTYVIKCVYHVALNLKRKHELIITDTQLPEDTTGFYSFDETEAFMHATLGADDLELYTLSIDIGMSDKETGKALNISARTVRRRLLPLKQKIKEYLSGSIGHTG